ncbi:UNVERIFIED_CONTAM: ATP-dependent RNA helicase A [Gekko kuhli]
MPHNAAACIAALRAAMEALVVEVTKNPEIISQLDQLNEHMLSVIRQISRPTAAGINLTSGSTRFGDGPRPPKMARFDNGGGYRGRGGGGYRGGYGGGYNSFGVGTHKDQALATPELGE